MLRSFGEITLAALQSSWRAKKKARLAFDGEPGSCGEAEGKLCFSSAKITTKYDERVDALPIHHETVVAADASLMARIGGPGRTVDPGEESLPRPCARGDKRSSNWCDES